MKFQLSLLYKVCLREIQVSFTHEIPVGFTNEILKLLGCMSIGVDAVALPSNNKQTNKCHSTIFLKKGQETLKNGR